MSTDAVCCSDNQHCCPHGSVCNVSEQTCEKLMTRVTSPAIWHNVTTTVCPGGKFQCADGYDCLITRFNLYTAYKITVITGAPAAIWETMCLAAVPWKRLSVVTTKACNHCHCQTSGYMFRVSSHLFFALLVQNTFLLTFFLMLPVMSQCTAVHPDTPVPRPAVRASGHQIPHSRSNSETVTDVRDPCSGTKSLRT